MSNISEDLFKPNPESEVLQAALAVLQPRMTEVKRKILNLVSCYRCGWCCRNSPAQVSKRDVHQISIHLNIRNPKKFRRKYCQTKGEALFLRSPCPFLERNTCKIYSARPMVCKLFPFKISLPVLSNINECKMAGDIYREIRKIPTEPDEGFDEMFRETIQAQVNPEKVQTTSKAAGFSLGMLEHLVRRLEAKFNKPR